METQLSFLFLLTFILLFQPSHSKTILVDKLAEWKNPTVHVGDSLIFKYKHLYNLYIFQNKRAFDLCNFTQATLLSHNASSASFTWHPSREGFFYFSFNNGSLGICQKGEKVAIRVLKRLPEDLAPAPSTAPPPVPGGFFRSAPVYIWPFPSTPPATSPSPSPVSVPSTLPDSGSGIPFINSNPAVPLPTGETDAVTFRPLPTSGHASQHKLVEGSLLQIQILLCLMFVSLYLV
ncbi:cupredoxin superfamily protein [Tasmannia lanceolata]|uniref:cupredoxin superfamily protein n=1 Tax=Tasmannia lanceolata TaxID=3420 RepID=UPI004062E391